MGNFKQTGFISGGFVYQQTPNLKLKKGKITIDVEIIKCRSNSKKNVIFFGFGVNIIYADICKICILRKKMNGRG